jgi:hypothetical protein
MNSICTGNGRFVWKSTDERYRPAHRSALPVIKEAPAIESSLSEETKTNDLIPVL